jgi:hypothetical protein
VDATVALNDPRKTWSGRIMDTPVKWIANLDHVQEVSLFGTADLRYWRDRLREEDLSPAERDGQAQILIVAADSKYMGVRFRELSFSVLVSWKEENARRNAVYLIRAYNSRRLFACVERVFFSAPYVYGSIRVSASLPASIHFVKNGAAGLRAEMASDSFATGREPLRRGVDGWEGLVVLPRRRRGNDYPRRFFIARLRGDTRVYSFHQSTDILSIRSAADCDVLQALADSHYIAEEWIVREDAAHAKSKTFTCP